MATIQTARMDLANAQKVIQTARIQLNPTPLAAYTIQTARMYLTFIKPATQFQAVGGSWSGIKETHVATGGVWQ